MRDCDKIEKLLWDRLENKLSGEDGKFLDKHLSECADCRQLESTINALAASKNADRKTIAGMDGAEFEDAVFLKIKAREREIRFAHEERGYTFRLYFSMGLAAAIVAFIVLSLGDLDRYIIPSGTIFESPMVENKQYDTVHITLKPEETKESPYVQPNNVPLERGTINKETVNLMPPPEVASIPESASSGELILGADMNRPLTLRKKESAGPGLQQAVPPDEVERKGKVIDRGGVMVESSPEGKEMTAMPLERAGNLMANQSLEQIEPGNSAAVQGYSILNEPVTKPAPDSVAINSMYLMDETSLSATSQSRAFSPQVIVNSGVVPGIQAPRSVLVTVDKMPIPVNIITPEYPVWARKNEISGEVWVKARVDTSGNVENAEIVSSNMPGYGFEESALKAAKISRYSPAEANGIKIGIWVIYPVKFIFKDKDSG